MPEKLTPSGIVVTRGRPARDTFAREWSWIIQNVIIQPTDGKWTLQQLKAIIALGMGKTKKKAALCTAGKDGKCVTSETIQNWMSIPAFQDSVEAVIKSSFRDYANEMFGQMYEDAIVPLTGWREVRVLVKGKGKEPDRIEVIDVPIVDPKMAMAFVKNRELVMKKNGWLKDGTGGTTKNQTAIQADTVNMSLQGTSNENLIAIGQRKKTVETVKVEQVEYEDSLVQDEIEDGVIDES